MELQNFIEKYVNQYLIGDIHTLLKVKPVESGGCGYPLVLTVCSGIELLGALTFPKEFNKDDGSKHFDYFWNNYLVQINSNYVGKSVLIYQLTRHGIAHVFLAKPGVEIDKKLNKHAPIEIDKNNKKVLIHLKSFSLDFVNAYIKLIKPNLSYELGFRMEKQLQRLIDQYSEQSNHYFGKYMPDYSIRPESLKLSRVSIALPFGLTQSDNFGTASIPNSTDINVSTGVPNSNLKKMT